MDICTIILNTMDLTGEYEDRNFILTRGDSRISMAIGKNEHTCKFGREHRFLIDEPASGEKLAYLLTKPLKVGHVFNGKGIYSFVLQEVVSTEYDNYELSVADYYKHFPKDGVPVKDYSDAGESAVRGNSNNGKKVWL